MAARNDHFKRTFHFQKISKQTALLDIKKLGAENFIKNISIFRHLYRKRFTRQCQLFPSFMIVACTCKIPPIRPQSNLTTSRRTGESKNCNTDIVSILRKLCIYKASFPDTYAASASVTIHKCSTVLFESSLIFDYFMY